MPRDFFNDEHRHLLRIACDLPPQAMDLLEHLRFFLQSKFGMAGVHAVTVSRRVSVQDHRRNFWALPSLSLCDFLPAHPGLPSEVDSVYVTNRHPIERGCHITVLRARVASSLLVSDFTPLAICWVQSPEAAIDYSSMSDRLLLTGFSATTCCRIASFSSPFIAKYLLSSVTVQPLPRGG